MFVRFSFLFLDRWILKSWISVFWTFIVDGILLVVKTMSFFI